MFNEEWKTESVDIMVNESLKYWLQFEKYKFCEKQLKDLRKGFVKEYAIVESTIDEELDLEEIPFILIEGILPNGDYILEWDYERVKF